MWRRDKFSDILSKGKRMLRAMESWCPLENRGKDRVGNRLEHVWTKPGAKCCGGKELREILVVEI